MYTQVGQQVGRLAMRGDRTMFLFTFADEDATGSDSPAAQKALLRKRFENSGWECPQILDALDASRRSLFRPCKPDTHGSAQGLWTRGRVTLVGDAACASHCWRARVRRWPWWRRISSRENCAALTGIMPKLLGDTRICSGHSFSEKQMAALRFAGAFAPKSKFALFLRNQIFNLMAIPWVADLAVGRDLADNIALPDY